MKSIKTFIIGATLVLSSLLPFAINGTAVAAETPVLQCSSSQEVVVGDKALICDLGINKQVSVNGAPFVDADTSADAASANVGDTITWKITVTNTSTSPLFPHGILWVHDVLPAGLNYVSDSPSIGLYNHNCGCTYENDWYIPLTTGLDPPASNLPATLTITTTAATTGLVENTATLANYQPNPSVDGRFGYVDGNSDNNSNDAWVNIQSGPKVLGESTTNDPQVLAANTLENTGSGTGASFAAAAILLATIAIAGYGRLYRKHKHYKLFN